jgi:hypothetical protein
MVGVVVRIHPGRHYRRPDRLDIRLGLIIWKAGGAADLFYEGVFMATIPLCPALCNVMRNCSKNLFKYSANYK